MGICIYLSISKSVTKEEWENVYEETLRLLEHFPFAELKRVKIQGVDTNCLVRTKEEEKPAGWFEKKGRMGWNTVGDYSYMITAEDYFLPRDLIGDNEIETNAGDAMFGALPAYMDYDWKDERFSHTYHLWGGKTQGEPYHIYLLAIAALIEARLGSKAFTYGDITRGQFKNAVEILNVYLPEPVDIPDRCDKERLLKRVSKFPISQKEQINVFEKFYLGTQEADFGDYIRQTFSEEATIEYWKDKFANKKIGTYGFDDTFEKYLEWGFGLPQLCEYVNFEDREGNLQYEAFVKRVMDAKLHLQEKDCADPLKIAQEEERPYGIATLFAQFAFAGARNKKVDRYIPIQEIKTTLIEALGDKCDVAAIIEEYLDEETKQIEINLSNKEVSKEEIQQAVQQDASEAFKQLMERKRKEMMEEREEYDINEYEDLKFYEDGDSIHPALLESVKNARKLIDEMSDDEELKKLLNKDAKKCYEQLQEMNHYIWIRDKDWEKIYNKIEKERKTFVRFYALMSIDMQHRDVTEICTALMINDELYDYCNSLVENEKKEQD